MTLNRVRQRLVAVQPEHRVLTASGLEFTAKLPPKTPMCLTAAAGEAIGSPFLRARRLGWALLELPGVARLQLCAALCHPADRQALLVMPDRPSFVVAGVKTTGGVVGTGQ